MKKLRLLALVLLPVLASAAWFEPTRTVRGWVCGDAFFAGRSTSYWRVKLASQDPVEQAEVPAKLRDAAAVNVLAELLSAPDPAVRWQAADILGKIGAAAWSATPKLAVALKDPDPHVRMIAAQAIGEIPTKGVDPAVIDGLKAMLSTTEKLPAIRALAKLGASAEPAVAELIHLLLDEDPIIRWNAAKTLGKIGKTAKTAIPDLVRTLKDTEAPVREHAAEALGDIGPDAVVAVPDLVAVLSDPDPRVRRDSVRALGEIGPGAKPALPAIEKLLTDPAQIVKDAAIVAKRRVAPDAATP